MRRTVRTYGDPVLRRKARPVDLVDDAVRALVRDLIETMRAERGVGLAAEQVGEALAVCVVEVPLEYDRDEQGRLFNPGVTMPLVLVNPRLVASSRETETADEGCLSFPGLYAPIPRPVEITVHILDLQGRPRTLTLRKFVARVVQHEMDHLDGVLLVDRLSTVKKLSLAGQLKRLKQRTREALAAASVP